MELSTVMTTLLSSDSLKNLSKKTGASQKEVKAVLTDALPLLLQGADKQAKGDATREGFNKALLAHAEDDVSDISAFMGKVDMADGAKILAHLLGAEKESTAKKISEKSSLSTESTTEILTAAAPLLMSLLGQETKKSSKSKSKSKNNELVGDLVTAVLDNVDVGSLLVGMLTDDTETKKSTTKKTTTKKSTAKKATTKKTTTKKSTTGKKMKAASEDEGIDLGDVASLLGKLLK